MLDPRTAFADLAAGRPHPSRRALLLMGLTGAALAACSGPSVAVGRSVSVDVIDRDTGQVLNVYTLRGRHYVAGRPGARYAIRISNQGSARLLAVTSVDGVNVVSGQTAAWSQTGYVFEPWQSDELTGWRKSDHQIAAFEFTTLPNSYAWRTGRPHDVGVIGVAVFRERVRPAAVTPLWGGNEHQDRAAEPGASRSAAEGSASRGGAAPAAQAPARESEQSRTERQDAGRDRLGTGHGEQEESRVSRTSFERAGSTPDEIVSVQYDRYENLVAAGVIPGDRFSRPRAFPGSPEDLGYVPDPPRE